MTRAEGCRWKHVILVQTCLHALFFVAALTSSSPLRWLPAIAGTAHAAGTGSRQSPAAAPAMAPAASSGSRSSSARALLLPTRLHGRGVGRAAEWDARIEKRLRELGVAPAPVRPTHDELKCEKAECLERLRLRHGVEVGVRARIDADTYGVKVHLLLVRAGEAQSSFDHGECANCTVSDAEQRLDEMIARALARRTGGAEGASPATASGASPGTAPAAAVAEAGGSRGGLGRGPVEGGPPDSRSPESRSPDIRSIDEPMARVPLSAPRPAWLTGADIGLGVAIAVGAVGVGLGARLLADDGKGTCSTAAPVTQCPQLASTAGLGAGLLVAGGVLVIGGAVAIGVLESRSASSRRSLASLTSLAPVVGPGLGGLSLGGTW